MKHFFYTISAWAELMAVSYPLIKSTHRQFFEYLCLYWLQCHNSKNMSCIANRDGIWLYHPDKGWIVSCITIDEHDRKRLSKALI